MSAAFQDHKESERLVRSLAGKVHRRLRPLPQGFMSFDDIEQELWIAWCKARDAFKPAMGVPWAAFLMRGMKQHINRVIEKHIERFEAQTFALSLDATSGDDENETTLGEAIPCSNPLPEELAEWKSNYDKAINVMTARARVFVSLLHEQPALLLDEVLIAQDKAEFAQKIGAPYLCPRRLTSAMVFDLMGANRVERVNITREVKKLGLRLSA